MGDLYTSGALLSDLRSTAGSGASTSVTANLPTLALNRYGVFPGTLPTMEMSGTDTISYPTPIYTDPLVTTYLPALLIDAAFGARISTDSDGAILPSIELSSRMGSIMTGLLSALSLSATASRPTLMSLSGKLPAIEFSSRAGSRGGDLKLPAMELSISANGYIVGKLSVSMPGLSISATGHTTTPMNLDQDLPPLKLTISMNGRVAGNLSEMLSALKITAEGRPNEYGTLSASLPSLLLSAGTGHGASMTLNAKIATLIMQLAGSGAAGNGSGSTASNASRFTDYVLRYVR